MATQQICLVQAPDKPDQLELSYSFPVPTIKAPNEVLVRVSAVALNPLDWKLVHYFPRPGTVVGCDFTGTIIARGNAVTDLAIGQRVCGAVVGSNPNRPSNGAFSKFLIADSRILLAVPHEWTDLQAAALGGVGWYTAGLAFYDDDALQLTGWPSCPVPAREDGSRIPILVYGGATASGTMFCQWLSRSGYAPIATASPTSSDMVKKYGAVATIDYNSPDSVEQIQKHSCGQLRHAIDCITSEKTMGICMKSICRVGGQYICLELYEPEWITRKAVRVAMVVGAEATGEGFELEGPYWRGPDPRKLKITMQMRQEMQRMINAEQIQSHPVHELDGGWSAILRGLQLLRVGGVRGTKLVVKIPQETQ